MRDATTVPEHELDQHRPSTATPHPEDRSDAMHATAATLGNAAFAGIVSRRPSRFRASALPGTSEVLARKKPKAPDAGASVGGSRGTAHFVGGTKGEENDTLAAGDKGFTTQMLKEVPKAAGRHFADYQSAHLVTVKPTFSTLHGSQMDYASKKERHASEQYGGIFYGTASTEQRWKDEEARWATKGQTWANDEARIGQMAEQFNAGVPRANQMFASLAKLESMQDMLGVSDPKAMNDAVVKSLEEAHVIAERQQVKGDGGLDVPQANQQVTTSAQEVNSAQKMMQATWLGVQKKLMSDRAKDVRAEGAKDEKRQAEINANLQFLKNVGKTIDLSMSVMSGGKTMIEGTSSTLSKSQLDDLVADENASVMDKSGIETAKAGGKAAAGHIAKSVGLEIPTDVGSLLETAGKIYYYKELETIRRKLKELALEAGKYDEVAKALDIQKDLDTFAAAVEAYQVQSEKQQKALMARTQAYLKFGQQLDATAQKDPKAAGSAPGKGQERFATVMVVTAAVRETLALGRGALAGIGLTPNQVGALWTEVRKNRLPLGWPDEEFVAVKSMYEQVKSFRDNVKNLGEQLGPIEAKAGEMMNVLAGGDVNAKKGDATYAGDY